MNFAQAIPRVSGPLGGSPILFASTTLAGNSINVVPGALIGFGDSRIQKSAGFTSSGGSYTLARAYSGGFLMGVEAGMNYILLPGSTGCYAVGASTTRNGTLRLNSASNATTGNTAQAETGNSADAAFNSQSTAEYTPVTDPGNIVFYLYSTNDSAAPTYFTDPKISMQQISAHLDALTGGNKVVFLANETPRGRGYSQNEVRPVSALACKTNSSTAVTVRRLRNRETGAIYSQVTTLTATGQFKVNDTAGNISFFTGDTITNAQIDYDYGNTTSGTYLNTVHNWLSSNASNFVDPDSGVNYAIPGALYNRPLVVSVDTWGALKNPATSGAATVNADGTLGDALHTNVYGANKVGAVYKAAILATFPTLTTKAKLPTKNAVLFATANGVLKTFTGTLPTVGMVPVTPGALRVYAGTLVGVDDGAGNITGTGISGTINYSTGALSITTVSTLAVNTKVEVYADSGSNLILNGMLDIAQGTGGALPSGVTGSIPKNWTISIDSDLQAAITGGTCTMNIDCSQTNPRTGFPEMRVKVQGTIGGTSGTTGSITFADLMVLPANRLTTSGAGDNVRVGMNYRVLPGDDGTVQAFSGVQAKCQAQTSVAVTRPGANGAGPNTAVTIAGATTGAGAALTPFDQQDLTAGVFEGPLLTCPVNVAGMTLTSVQTNVIAIFEKAKYVSFTAAVSQVGMSIY